MTTYRHLLCALCVAVFAPLSVYAGEIEDAIQEGLSAYKSGDLTTAAAQLDYAATLIRQAKAGKITAVFPEPFPGWEADQAESNSAGGMMMGGGITANRSYSKGDARVDIQLVMDSPMLQSMMAMFSNPSMIAMTGGKLTKVQGHKAMFKKESEEDMQITLIVNNNALFTLDGSGVSEKELKAYAEKLNLNALN